MWRALTRLIDLEYDGLLLVSLCGRCGREAAGGGDDGAAGGVGHRSSVVADFVKLLDFKGFLKVR